MDRSTLVEAMRSRQGADLAAQIEQALNDGATSDDIASAYQELLASRGDARRAKGAFYTPAAMVDRLVGAALEAAGARSSPTPLRILDPACGLGAFLRGAARWYDAHRPDLPADVVADALYGIDIDGDAIAIARVLLKRTMGADARLYHADALLEDVGPAEVDVVLANPPFGNAIEKRTKRTESERRAYAERYPNAATGAYDKAGLFLELASQRLSPAGVLASVVPRALLAAPYADRLRATLTRRHGLRALLTTEGSSHFQAADVYVAGVVLGGRASAPRHLWLDGGGSALPTGIPEDAWGSLVSPHAAVFAGVDPTWPTLGELVRIQASATTGEAYDLRSHVSDTVGTYRLVTTGAIEPFELRWGAQKQRYLKQTYLTPRIPREGVSPQRAALYAQPKVIVAGLSRVLEAAVDAEGGVAGAVATVSITRDLGTPVELTLDRIAGFLNSAYARRAFLAQFGALALGGGSVQVTKKKLGALRVPPLLFATAGEVSGDKVAPPGPTHHPAGPTYLDEVAALAAAAALTESTAAALLDRPGSPGERIGCIDLALCSQYPALYAPAARASKADRVT